MLHIQQYTIAHTRINFTVTSHLHSRLIYLYVTIASDRYKQYHANQRPLLVHMTSFYEPCCMWNKYLGAIATTPHCQVWMEEIRIVLYQDGEWPLLSTFSGCGNLFLKSECVNSQRTTRGYNRRRNVTSGLYVSLRN